MIKNYCSAMTPEQREMGINPRTIKGLALYVSLMRAYSNFSYTYNKNNKYMENYAASEGSAILNHEGMTVIINGYF